MEASGQDVDFEELKKSFRERVLAPGVFSTVGEEEEIRLKLVIIGDPGVGKTSIRDAYVGRDFEEFHSNRTGVNFTMFLESIDEILYRLQIWDMEDASLFDDAKTQFYFGASGCLLVYDQDKPATFSNLKHWVEDCWRYSGKEMLPCVVVCNKADRDSRLLVDSRAIGEFTSELNERSQDRGFTHRHFIVSAKTGYNVRKAFQHLIKTARELSKKSE